MFESGWGFQEIMLIGIMALVVVGPERLPGLARKAGFWFGKLKRFVSSVKEDIEHEVSADELKRVLKEQIDASGIHEIIEETKDTFNDVKQEYLVNAMGDDELEQSEDNDKDSKKDKEKNNKSAKKKTDAKESDSLAQAESTESTESKESKESTESIVASDSLVQSESVADNSNQTETPSNPK